MNITFTKRNVEIIEQPQTPFGDRVNYFLAQKRSNPDIDCRFRTCCERAGITAEYYIQRRREIGNHCELCGKIPSFGMRLEPDHDHKTGKFRGLLCRSCNGVLGSAERGISNFKKVTKKQIDNYLNRWQISELKKKVS